MFVSSSRKFTPVRARGEGEWVLYVMAGSWQNIWHMVNAQCVCAAWSKIWRREAKTEDTELTAHAVWSQEDDYSKYKMWYMSEL